MWIRLLDQLSADCSLGPREISVLRKSAVPILYGPASECLKSTWYGQTGNDPKKCSIHMTRDFNDHRLRRRAWDKGFSIKGMYTYTNLRLHADSDQRLPPTSLVSKQRRICSGTVYRITQGSLWISLPGRCISALTSWVRLDLGKTSTILLVVSSTLPSKEYILT
jgi:hypothetical protein